MRVSVFGLGYVGCVTAACLAEGSHRVIGVDINPDKVAMINAGTSPLVEPGLGELLGRAYRALGKQGPPPIDPTEYCVAADLTERLLARQ